MSVEVVFDCTGSNLAAVAPLAAEGGIRLAGYVTGSGGVPWSAAQFAAHPGSVRIDQTPAGTGWDATADVDDYEAGAVSLAELAPRARARMAAYATGTRPGQRRPAVYASQSNITAVANALVKGGVTSGVGLWVANWSVASLEAILQVVKGSGPFPVIGFQVTNAGAYDVSLFSSQWLNNVSGSSVPVPVSESLVSVSSGGKVVFNGRFPGVEVTVS